MAKVHFAPYSAIRYVGGKSKEFVTSLARPKPMLKKGDIVIVDKKTAFNLVNKGFGEFVYAESIEFTKADVTASALQHQLDALQSGNDDHVLRLTELQGIIEGLQADNDALVAVNAQLQERIDAMGEADNTYAEQIVPEVLEDEGSDTAKDGGTPDEEHS